eukprot:scaffold29253_cov31-Prasinocladus_malaysianus.AAC.1
MQSTSNVPHFAAESGPAGAAFRVPRRAGAPGGQAFVAGRPSAPIPPGRAYLAQLHDEESPTRASQLADAENLDLPNGPDWGFSAQPPLSAD